MLFNKTKATGYLYYKFKNMKYSGKKLVKQNIPLVAHDLEGVSEDDEKKLLEFFEGCVVPKDKKLLLEKLMETVDIRSHIFRRPDIKLFDKFSFYFVDPQIVRKQILKNYHSSFY